jgi:hypothetical protein
MFAIISSGKHFESACLLCTELNIFVNEHVYKKKIQTCFNDEETDI